VQRLVADRARRGLDDAGVGVRFHQPHQRRQALAGHDAVGIEDDEVAVAAPQRRQKSATLPAFLLTRRWRQR
jgi:hypothetical protein